MKKKMIWFIVGAVLLIGIGFSLFKASQYTDIHIQKTVTIDAPVEEAFAMVQYLEQFPKWSPFLAQDPTQTYEVKGQDGQIGAQYHWEGNEGKDLGYQEIVALEVNRHVGMQCSIQKPFEATPTFDYTFSPSGSGVTVTQDFRLHSSHISALFLWIFGAEAEMEATNAQGLALLKEAVEG